MNKRNNIFFNIKLIDFIPALSGLIGKTALVTSFAVIWAKELNISTPGFVFENVRMELLISGIITLIGAMFYKNIAPSGTLAPLIVLVPAMASFGVHPFILSIMVGIFGILSIKTRIFHKLLKLCGSMSKTSLTLTFGISGVIMSSKNLYTFFENSLLTLILMGSILVIAFILLVKLKRNWLVIPLAAIVAILIPMLFGIVIPASSHLNYPKLNPSFWWNDMWGIGFGFEPAIILKTIPFAAFVILLWAIDTVSITTMFEANDTDGESGTEFELERSFLITSIRNMIGGGLGGAQTAALWRSYLIPLIMVKRPLRSSSVLLGLLGITAGFFAVPIKILSFPPLIWSVLLFGIFLPFVMVGLKNLQKTEAFSRKLAILLLTAVGVIYNPLLTWIGAIILEKLLQYKYKR